MPILQDIKALLSQSNKIAIFSHSQPDADAISSSLALKQMIKDNFSEKQIDIFIDGELPTIYSSFSGKDIFNEQGEETYDIAVALDSSSVTRLGKFKDFYLSTKTKINIDHHKSNDKFGDINLVHSVSSSTCELLYLLFTRLNLVVTDETAKNIYIGIITDTNLFTSASMRARTHLVTGEVLKYNFDANAIKDYFFKNNSKSKTMLLEKALHSLKFFDKERISYMKLSYADLLKTQGTFEDTLGVVDQGVALAGVQVAIFVIEKEPDVYHISLRSKDESIDLSEIAKAFEGGGHKTVAAFQCGKDINKVLFALVTALKDELKKIPFEEVSEMIF